MKVLQHLAMRAAAVALLPVFALPAAAQPMPPGQEGELGKLLPPVPGRRICFARTYDAAHLQAHPKQKVTRMIFQIRYHRYDPEKDNPQGQRNYYFSMAVRVKGHEKTLYASGECVPAGNNIHCGVECDGGGVGIA